MLISFSKSYESLLFIKKNTEKKQKTGHNLRMMKSMCVEDILKKKVEP